MEKVTMKGAVVAAYAQGSTVFVWVQSPTGDSSDSFTYRLPCINESQAAVVAEMWRRVWELES